MEQDQDQMEPMEVNGDGHQGGTIDIGAGSDGPPSMVGVGPPSPLTGCYLLIIIGEPHSQDHKDIILQRLIKGFLSWNVIDCHVDLEDELHTITLQALDGEEGKHGERLIQYASENLVTEILIHPQVNTFIQCIRNLLSSFTRHRHIIHTGYTFSGNGSWILQDGTFSVVDFMEAFQEHEVQRVLRAYPDTITMDVHCAPIGQWHTIQDKSFSRFCQIRMNPVDVLSSGSEKLNSFVAYLSSMIIPTEISELLESSDVVGNIRFSHPTLYVFPGGQGDAALFGINGFNMLVDGGFSRKSCFWDFVRHLDRLDAVLMTRINNTNIKGISSVVERKSEAHVYPQIGHFFCNIPERKSLPSPDGDKDRDPLLVDIIQEGHQIVTNLKSLNLKAQTCYRDIEPINLYHKVGHGTLDMYVISPARDSREVKDFLTRWAADDMRLFTKEAKEGKDFAFPLHNLISICALLVWTPANPEDNITRILFPGSAPEYKILEGLEKMKNVEFMRQPVCPVKSISASLSTPVLVTKKSLKSASTDRILAEPIHSSKSKDNKLIDNKMKMMHVDNKLAADMMDSSADEGKMEKQLSSKLQGTATVASAKVESKSKSTRSGKSIVSAEKKFDNKKMEQQHDEKKDSISDISSDKEDQLFMDKSKPLAVDSEKSLDEPLDTQEKIAETESAKPELDTKEKKKEDAPSTGADSVGVAVKATKKPPVSRTLTSATARSKVETSGKGSKSTVERKPIVKKQTEANKSSPTTPKKIGSIEAKLLNGNAEDTKKTVGKSATTKATPVVGGKPGKSSPKATPAKSTKDENNRKVLEARQRPTTVAKRDTLAARKEVEKKELLSTKAQTERKPISRRPKGAAPAPSSVAPIGGSPVKGKKVLKSEKDAVIRKAKLDKNGTTDSSLVSTPSADEAVVPVTKRAAGMAPTEVAPSDSDALDAIKKQQQLAELKEEQEAVREIEAVFNRDSAAQKALKHRELALAEDHREVQDSATEPEEEEEYLIIEKEEQYTEDSINEPESSATKEEEIQKHQRDSQESEKRKRDSLEEDKGEKIDSVKDVGEAGDVEEIQGDGKSDTPLLQGEGEQEPRAEEDHDEREKDEQGKLSPQHKQELEEEVQEIIASAKEIAKSKMETSMDGLKTEEISSISPDEKISSTKKTSDTRDEEQEHPLGHMKDHIDPPLHESHHEERVSATVESGATTTAPTLPEDERIPLDEIKEDLVIEEKHVKEQTKEIEVVTTVATDATAAIRAELPSGPELAPENVATATAPLQTVYEPLERPTPAKMQFSAQQAHMRDVVKTPDEVADLPVHEEADIDEDYTEDKDKNIKESEEKDRDTKEMPEEEVAGAVSSARLAPTIAALETDAKQLEKTDDGRNVADKSVKSDKLCDTAMKVTAVEELIEKVNQDAQVETPRKLDAHHTEQHDPSKAILDDDAILRDLESQIIPAETPVGEKLDNIVHVELQHQVKLEEETLVHGIVGDKSMHPVEEELIVAKKAVPRIPQPPVTSVLDDIWQTPDKAEEKLEELKHFIDDKAKNSVPELVAIKDTMVKSVVEHKDEINDKVLDGTKQTDLKIKDVIEDVSQNVEQMAIQTAEEVVKVVTGKVDSVLDNLQEKTKQVDDVLMTTATNLDEKVASFATDVSQVVTKTDEALASITAEKNELEQLAKELKQDMIGQLDDTRKQLDDDFARNVEKLQDKAKTGISSFFGGITEGIKSGIEKVSDKVEHKMKDKVEEVEAKLQQVTVKIDVLKTTSQEPIPLEKEPTYDRFGGAYERSFTQELRETHITTVDSPVTEGDKMSMELKAMVNIPHDIDEDKELEELEAKKNLGTFVIEDIKYSVFEDANLREIKEEEEEDRVSPPQGTSEKLSTVLGMMPPRARTPEDVAKIVANVAEVLKSDKDLEDIIPGFDPQELERKLSQGAAREEDVGTVQRMLVTASSEDGGEETVICADGTITFSKSVTPEPMQTSGTTTPEIKVQEENEDDEEEGAEDHVHASSKDATVGKRTSYEKGSPISSGKSSPDLKTSPTSIEEKDKHELPEKIVQIDASKSKSHQELPTTVSDTCKDSVPDHQTYDLIDDTRRESAISTFSERDYTKDESSFVDERDSSRAHSISSHISDLKDDSADLKSVTDFLKESEKERDQVFADADIKLKELSSPESVASQNMITEKVSKILEANETHTQESSKPIDTIELESKMLISLESTATKKEYAMESNEQKSSKDKADSMDFSRPDSPASAEDISHDDVISAKDGQYARDAETTNVRVHLKESASLDLAEELPDTKQFSRPESPASAEELSQTSDHMSKESRPASAASLVTDKAPSKKSVDLKTEIKTDSRPSSAASGTGFSFEKSVDLKAEAKSDSRPASAASAPDDKAPSEKSVDLKAETKEDSRPASAASGTDAKAAPQNSVDLKAGAKEDSRPASAASGSDDKALSEKSIDLKAEIKEDSRPASAASVPDDKAASVKSVDLKAETKEDSRPASAASGTDAKAASENSADLKAEAKEDSRPASAASGADIKASSDKSVDVKADSRPASAASAPDDKAASVKSVDLKAETKEDSRPASAASGTDAKAAPQNSVDLKAGAKEDSRPASAASGSDDKALSEKSIDLKAEIKEDSRPASAASVPDDKAASVKSVDLKAETKEDSRPASAASGTDAKAASENSADLKAEAKEDSRPASAASGADIKASSDKSVDVKADSRPASATSAPDDKAASVKSVDLKAETKEDSRPASAASGTDAKAASENSADLKAEAKEDSRLASAASGGDDKALSEKSVDLKAEIKEDSRPASAASGADIKPSSDKSVHVKADSRPASAASGPDDKAISEKSVDIKAEAKEDSRPASAASGADIKPSSDKSVELKADSRPASATSAPDENAASEKSVELKAEIHSDSRPASAVSVADEKSSSVKSVDLNTALKEDSRPASAASGLDDKAISEKSVDLKAEIKEDSRPASAASGTDAKAAPQNSVDLKAGAKEDSRPASAASGADDKALSEKPVDLKAEIKEDSRPASAASGADIKPSSDKSVDVKADSRPASSASALDDKAASVKSVDLKAETKEDSRPASAASGTDAKASPENTVDLKAEAKEDSRPASAASGPDDKAISEKSVDLKAETKEDSRPASAASGADIKASTDKSVDVKADSRPASSASAPDDKAASVKSVDLKAETKEDSRPASAASGTDAKASPENTVDLKAGAKEDSRPASAASGPDDKAISEKSVDLKAEIKEDSRPSSAASPLDDKTVSKKSVDIKSETKEDSRPASAASAPDDKAPSEQSVVLTAEAKSDSRPISAASAPDDKAPSEKSVDLKAEIKEDSRPASAASAPDDNAASDRTVDLKAETKPDSRPASAASAPDDKAPSEQSVDLKTDNKANSRPASAASVADDKAISEKSLDLKTEPKTDSRPASAASGTDIKASLEKPVDLKADSRPASAASAPDDKAASENSADLKAEAKEDSRPASAASGPDDKAISEKSVDLKAEIKEDSRPVSAASGVDIKASSEKSVELKAELKEDSRPASAASAPDDKAASVKSVDLKAETKEDSRPASATSDADDKSSSVKSEELKAQPKTDSRPASAASGANEKAASEKSGDLKAETKEDSRPASAASAPDDKAPSEQSVDLKAEPKIDSRPASAASGADIKASSDKSVDLKPETKEDTRPPSAASGADDKAASEKSVDLKAEAKEDSRPASVASGTDAKADSKKSVDLKAEPKTDSRPVSAASGADDKAPSEKYVDLKAETKADSRPDSAASGTDTQADSKKSVDLKAETKEDSRPASAASGADDKALSVKSVDLKAETKEDSRPASAASGTDAKADSQKSVDLKAETKEISRPTSAGGGVDDKAPFENSVDQKAENTADARPVSAASGVDYKAFCEKSVDLKEEIQTDSRPASAASALSEKATSEQSADVKAEPTSASRPASAASGIVDQAPYEKFVDMQPDIKTTSRPASSASCISEHAYSEKSVDMEVKIKAESEKIETKVESCAAQFETIQKSSSTVANMCPLSDGEDDDLEKKICMKETRSKSMSAAVTSVGHRSGFEGSSLGVLEESIITSRDDLDMLRTSRDNTVESTKSQLQTEKAPMKPLKPLFSEFPATKDEDQKYEPNSVFPKCGLDSAESPEHGAAIIAGTDQLLKDTVISMKEVEKMTSSVISSTVVKKEESSTESKTSSTVFPVSANVESGKSSPYLGEKSHESSAKSVSPQPDKDSLEESSVSMNTFIEKDSLSESTSKHRQQIVTSVSVTKESSSEMFAIAQKTGDELLLAGTKTPPTAPISPNVSAKEGSGMGQTHFEASILDGATSASSMATTMASSVTASTGPIAQKDDVSGISTPKESVPSGKSSPGLMSVHTQGSTDSASKSMNLGHSSSGIETSDSSPKPTSPFPKVVVDTLKLADETKTTSGMSTPDMTRSSTPDMVDSQIERIISTEGERSDSQTTVTTTTTTTKTSTYIVKDGQKIEVDSNVQSDRVINTETQDQKASEGSSGATSITTVTTTYVVKDGEKVEIESNVNTGILEQPYDGVTSAKSSAPVQLTLAGTEERSLAEDYDEKDVLSPRSDISSGQASRIVAGWHDEDVPGSPMSMTSQAPLSPSTKYTYDYDLQHSSSGVSKKSDIEIDQDSQDDIVPPQYGSDEAKSAMPIMSSYKPDPMSTSFYGQLPEVPSTMPLGPTATRSIPIPITGSGKSFSKPYVEYASSGESSVDSGHKASVTMSSDRKYLDEADLDFEKAFSGTRKTDNLMTTSMHFSSEKEFMTATTTIASLAQTQKMEMDFTSTGLPSSVTTTVTGAQPSVTAALSQPEQSPQQQPQAQSQSPLPQSTQLAGQAASSSSAEAKSVLDSWGKPLGLPSPAPITSEDNKTTPKKERRMMMTKTKLNNEKNLRKRAESPTKGAAKKAASPVYVDLSYVPHHGNSYYANVEFFKRVRARYYVFSGTEPSREVYNALLEAKQCWEDKELEVTIIPTYDTDVLGYWVSENEELLAKYHIDLSPSAARCTINLQDHETSCSAYRLEF